MDYQKLISDKLIGLYKQSEENIKDMIIRGNFDAHKLIDCEFESIAIIQEIRVNNSQLYEEICDKYINARIGRRISVRKALLSGDKKKTKTLDEFLNTSILEYLGPDLKIYKKPTSSGAKKFSNQSEIKNQDTEGYMNMKDIIEKTGLPYAKVRSRLLKNSHKYMTIKQGKSILYKFDDQDKDIAEIFPKKNPIEDSEDKEPVVPLSVEEKGEWMTVKQLSKETEYVPGTIINKIRENKSEFPTKKDENDKRKTLYLITEDNSKLLNLGRLWIKPSVPSKQ